MEIDGTGSRGDAVGDAISSESVCAEAGGDEPSTRLGQRAELQGSLGAMSQESSQDFDPIEKALFEQQQRQNQLVEALAQCEQRWENRLEDLRKEIVALGAQSTEAFQKVARRLESDKSHRHAVNRELAKLQESDRERAQADRSTAEMLENYQAHLEKTEHEISNLKLTLTRLAAAHDRSKHASDAQKQHQAVLENVQQSHETRLQKFGQRVEKLNQAVSQFRDQFVTEQTQNGEALPTLRAAVEANEEQLSALIERAKQNDRTLQFVSAHQEEMAERIAEMNEELLERITALEASWKKRFAPQVTHDKTGRQALRPLKNSATEHGGSTIVVVKGSQASFQGNRIDDLPPRQPPLGTLPKVDPPDEETSEATDRLLNRQLDRVEADGRWRKWFRRLLALALILLVVAVALQYGRF